MKNLGIALFSTMKKNIPLCSDCKFYILNWYSDFNSANNKCKKFIIKSEYTGEPNYETVSNCRKNKHKCGIDGKYFEKDPNVHAKRIIHYFDRNRHVF